MSTFLPKALSRFMSSIALLGALGLSGIVIAQDAAHYPNKPVRLVAAYTPGGGTDITARIIAERMSALLGQSVFVANLPGASGTIGAAAVARSKPDGYNLLFGASAELTLTRYTMRELAYDSLRDFTPLTLVAHIPYVLAVRDGLPVNTLQEFLALAKERDGDLTFASNGVNTTAHMISELLKHEAGIKFLQVPYKGSVPGLLDLQAGHVDFTIDTLTASLTAAEAGRIRILAIATVKRSEIAQNIPTFAESGLPGFTRGTWFGVLAPSATPQAIKDTIAQTARKVVESDEVREMLRQRGMIPAGGPPEDFDTLIRTEIDGWSFLAAQQQ